MTAEHPAMNNQAKIHRRGTSRRLNGWKEIGSYFQKNERTVKRWEQRGMPVHRLPGGAKTAVFAYADELDSWLNSSRNVTQTEAAEPDSPSEQPPQPQPARHRRYIIAAAIGLALVLVLGAGQLIRQSLVGAPDPAATMARYQPGPAASQLYLSGLYHWNTRTAEGLKQSLDEFRQAIGLEPDFAAAQAALANAYSLLAQYGVMKPVEAYPLAKAAAEKAIAPRSATRRWL